MLSAFKKYACLILLPGFLSVAYAQNPVSFVNISAELVNHEVTAIVQDNNGFMWFGTRGGLHRFDGYDMKLLKNEFNSRNNFLSQSIEVLMCGRDNLMWIGTKSGGLSSYNLLTGKIKNYNNNNKTASGFNADYILSLLDTDADKLLIGTWKGVQYLDKKNGHFTILNTQWKTFDIQPDQQGGVWLATDDGLHHFNKNWQSDAAYDFGVPGINITSIVTDTANHCLWLGTWRQGLIKFDLHTGQWKFFQGNGKLNSSFTSDNTYRILLDSKGTLWVGTWGGGLYRFDRSKESFEKVDLSIPGLFTTDNQIILAIHEDPSGLLWVGTDGAGIFKFDLNQKKFVNIGYKANAIAGSTHVLSVYVDPYQKLWLGSKGGGIQYSTDWKSFTPVSIQGEENTKLLAPLYDSRSFLQVGDYLWIGTINGLIRIENKGKQIGKSEIFSPQSGNSKAISGRKITSLVKGSDGKIWIGTQENGLSCIIGFDKKNQPLFKNYYPEPGVAGALQNERVSALLIDSKQRCWIGTYKGLYLYHPETDNFSSYLQTGQANQSLSNNTILCLAEDKFGNIWAGTQYGINKITGIFGDRLQVTSLTTQNGLPSDYIHAIIPDNKGNIWASTNKGIVSINQSNLFIAVFDKRDGILSDVFSENAFFKDTSNRIYFGGVEGLTYFNPDSIRINHFQPPIYFTNIQVNNQPYELGNSKNDSSSIFKPFYGTKSLTLTYQENIFSIEFAALDFHAPDKNEYMYKLEGFNKDWVYAGNNRQVSFTNLKAGTYFLKVKATNSDKIWNNQPHELKINILPPPWKTWWAYSIYIVVFIFLLWLTRYFGMRQVALKNQLIITRLARNQENELANFKERLFTNISHEFRTPLTLISGPIDDLLQRKKFEKPVEKSLRLIQKQSRRLLRMVNQLLDYQKAETGNLKLTLQPGELVSFCQDVFSGFTDEANRRDIDYSFTYSEKFLPYTFDHNKMEIILFNVLANAFKFTPSGEKICMNIQKNQKGEIVISVKDTGKGIAAEDISRIFDRFYRGKETDATTISGTGIGLSFVKELTTLHGGSIVAESNGVKGSLFIITLPASSLQSINYPANGNFEPVTLQQSETNLNNTDMTEIKDPVNLEQEQPIILVVEDEADIREYIMEILAPSYKVLTAVNGREGVEKALEYIPDLIVSDIMMPEKDGLELCRELKSNKDTSHIPIILLTALSDMTHHVQGIQEGADVYLPKPFNSQLLLVHIHNLITSRNKLKELYAKRVLLGTGNFEIKTYEEEFLYKLMKLVEENISDSNFGNDDLANLMFMSRSTFYRKLKAVTGMSGNEFIRTARLNYAVKLLESGKYSVNEAAFEAGFNDIKYFRKRFQEQFGHTPSEFKK